MQSWGCHLNFNDTNNIDTNDNNNNKNNNNSQTCIFLEYLHSHPLHPYLEIHKLISISNVDTFKVEELMVYFSIKGYNGMIKRN